MLTPIEFALPQILDQFSGEQLIAAVPKIELRKIYWDDIKVGETITYEVELTEKLGLIFALLTGSPGGGSIVPSALVMGFISAVGGCYLGGENIFLVKKGEANFYSPIPYDTKTLIITGEFVKKHSKVVKGKERYYADIDQSVYIREGSDLIKVGETKAFAGILQKSRPKNQQKDDLIPKIKFTLTDTLSQLKIDDLRNATNTIPNLKAFDELEEGDTVEISIRVSHKMVLLFALISGDFNPLHTDPLFAKNLKAFYGQNLALGALLTTWFSGIGALKLLGAGYRLIKKEEAFFKRAVKVGDKILIRLNIKVKYTEIQDETKKYFIDVEEKLFLEHETASRIEAVVSGSRYKILE